MIFSQFSFPSFFFLTPSVAATQPADSSTTIPDALQPQFTPPAPGTYTLPIIDTIHDHSLLNTKGERTNLFSLTENKIAVISFMYTSCADVGGCPLAAAVLHQLDHLLSQRPETARHVTLLSVSFDPRTRYTGADGRSPGQYTRHTDWHFLTSATTADLQPVLT